MKLLGKMKVGMKYNFKSKAKRGFCVVIFVTVLAIGREYSVNEVSEIALQIWKLTLIMLLKQYMRQSDKIFLNDFW